MITTDIRLATTSLKSAKVRTFLTMVAVIIGVAGFVMVSSFVDGLKQSVETQIQEFGGNLVTVNPGDLEIRNDKGEVVGFNPLAAFGGVSTLTEKDVADIRDLDSVVAAAPQMIISLTGKVTRNDTLYEGLPIFATNEDYPEAIGQNVAVGSFFKDDDTRGGQLAVLGSAIAEEMFSGGFGLGAQLHIKDETFTVVAVMEEVPSSGISFGVDFNRVVVIPIEAGKTLNNGVVNIGEIDIQADPEIGPEAVADEVDTLLLKSHHNERDFTVLSEDEIVNFSSSILDQIKVAAQALSYVMLFVGGVVIALIMLITVKERTREIGIRKSIGATNANIRNQFIVEAVVISWLGSLVGVALAYGIGFYVSRISDLSPVYTLNTLIAVVVISTVIGTISGLIPAGMAAKKDPVQALRDE